MLLPFYVSADVITKVWQIYFNHCRLVFLPLVFGFGDFFDLGLMLLPPIDMADVIAYVHYG